jgi:hypothetical protein
MMEVMKLALLAIVDANHALQLRIIVYRVKLRNSGPCQLIIVFVIQAILIMGQILAKYVILRV